MKIKDDTKTIFESCLDRLIDTHEKNDLRHHLDALVQPDTNQAFMPSLQMLLFSKNSIVADDECFSVCYAGAIEKVLFTKTINRFDFNVSYEMADFRAGSMLAIRFNGDDITIDRSPLDNEAVLYQRYRRIHDDYHFPC